MADVTITVRSAALGDFEYTVDAYTHATYNTTTGMYEDNEREAIQQAIVSTAARAASAYRE